MAVSPVQALQDEITCTICLDYFTEPMMIVGCGHNFCRDCISEYWRGSSGSGGVSCPQCRAVFPRPVLTQNRQLGNVVEVTRKLSLQSAKKADSAEKLCQLHKEPLKLFCQKDRVPVCVVCDRAKEHREHPVVPIEEAAQEQKEQIQRRLETLRQWRDTLEEAKENGEKASQELLEKAGDERQRSVAEVEKFCQFLIDQVQFLEPHLEELRSDILQRQTEHESKCTREITRLSNLIDDLERKCEQPETEFLQETGNIWDSIESEQSPQPEEDLVDLKERLGHFALHNITVTKTLQKFKGLGQSFPTRVLICGHSIIFWAFKRACSSEFGTQLGLGAVASIRWAARRGMNWEQLLPTVWEDLQRSPPPRVLVVHLGEDDLNQRTGLSLRQQACSDFAILRTWVPGLTIVWSEMLQRRVWEGARSMAKVDRARKMMNAHVGRHVVAEGGVVIRHPEIIHSQPELFSEDGVHLSEEGNAIFLADLQWTLRELLVGQGEEGSLDQPYMASLDMRQLQSWRASEEAHWGFRPLHREKGTFVPFPRGETGAGCNLHRTKKPTPQVGRTDLRRIAP